MSAAAARSITDVDLRRLRMRALGLAGTAPGHAGPGPGDLDGAARTAGVVRRMLALQGQDWRASRWALGLRAPASTVNDVHAAFDAGLIVRSWPMRSTVHLVAAEDIGWIQRATNHRVLPGAVKRREYLGISDAVLERLVDVSISALANGASHDRDSLAAIWSEAGIEWKSNWRYHVIWWLCQNGIAVFGPTGGGTEPRIVLAEDWIRTPRDLAGDAALTELASRFAAARGPVHTKDFAWWTGLTAGEAKRGIALAAESGALAPLRRDGAAGAAGQLWAAPELLDAAASREPIGDRWRLLPAFDEHLLGYTVRDAQLEPQHFAQIVPGRNGVFRATVVDDGRVVATWKRGAGQHSGLEVTPFPGTEIDLDALGREAGRWAEFHGLDPVLPALRPATPL